MGAGVPVENARGAAAVLAEANLRHSDALDAARHHVMVTAAAMEIARAQGRAFTSLANYSDGVAGASRHAHQSRIGTNGAPVLP
ncbi:glutamine synthetase [Pikeienuella piscinae]|uniref:Glutamine synthetase n=1 Tax=Pikeienuella piscinae TaxID=2748098 RepID=A0A7L5C116_9RHOB|nr:glutamine synthetase [Pikeienuella piscinae]QIE57093.1 glutamine synthetase [Pikeienuella piscinae]